MNTYAMMPPTDPFPTIAKLAAECGEEWPAYGVAAARTHAVESALIEGLRVSAGSDRILDPDSSLVLCGSFARYEMVPGSDCDWTLLINGVVDNHHPRAAREISGTIEKFDKAEKAQAGSGKGILSPGSSGTFGNMSFAHDLVHRIGGAADSNANLTRRILMLLESRPVNISTVDSSRENWQAVVHSVLERYFEEEVHFSPGGARMVPRFLLNDLTRYWRTICVDYAAKHQEQDGHKWAIRNAKLRFSRKLLYTAGLAFCFSCHLDPPTSRRDAQPDLFSFLESAEPLPTCAAPFIAAGEAFAETPPLEYLAAFVDAFVSDLDKRRAISCRLFGTYNGWLELLGDDVRRKQLETLSHDRAGDDPVFQEIRRMSRRFSSGLQFLFFDRDVNPDEECNLESISNLSHEYVAF
jgi:hypothetical protein